MQDLVGQCFTLLEGNYRIVDVRHVGGDAMVYAEEVRAEDGNGPQSASPRIGAAQGPSRAAFHYGDIADYLRREPG